MQRPGQYVVVLIVAALTVTCARITVNVYFPAAEIRDAATQIEREVRSEDTTPPESTPPDSAPPAAPSPKPQSFSVWPRVWQVRLVVGPALAVAQAININVQTPAIRKLVASRKQRYARLAPLFAQGALGENNRGLLDIRALEALSLKDKASAKTLLEQENRDRQQLYREIATANNLPADKLEEIASIFAQVHRQEAKAGWWIQDASGNWKKK
jgi:uncharacterized protein YdbL (DUF1318 family)